MTTLRPKGFQVRCFVVAGFLLTSASRGPSAIAEPLVCQSVQGFGSSEPQNFAISIGLAGRSYNSVSTAVLHCEILVWFRPIYIFKIFRLTEFCVIN